MKYTNDPPLHFRRSGVFSDFLCGEWWQLIESLASKRWNILAQTHIERLGECVRARQHTSWDEPLCVGRERAEENAGTSLHPGTNTWPQ